MTNEELIAKIKAEIERRMDKHWEGLPNADAPEDDWTHNELCELGAYKELEHLEAFISDLESENPVPKDLEEAAESHAKTKYGLTRLLGAEMKEVEDDFIAGAKWQEKRNLRFVKQVLSGDFTVFEAGRKYEREQMMKEAVEGTVMDFSSNRPRPQVDVLLDPHKYHTGDKVRIIIVKED